MEKYFHVDHAMKTCITASTNLVTKSQRYAKSHDFLEKLITCFHWKRTCCCVWNVVTSLRMFLCEFDRKMEEKLKDSLQLIWSLKYNILFGLSSSENSSCDKIGLPSVLKMATCCSSFVPATKCCCIKAKAAKNFWHCYLGLSKICWTICLVSSPRSLPLKQLRWICLMALRWWQHNLNLWLSKPLMYQRFTMLFGWIIACSFSAKMIPNKKAEWGNYHRH